MGFSEFRSRWAPRAQNGLFSLAKSMIFPASNLQLFTFFLKSVNSSRNSVISVNLTQKRKKSLKIIIFRQGAEWFVFPSEIIGNLG